MVLIKALLTEKALAILASSYMIITECLSAFSAIHCILRLVLAAYTFLAIAAD